MPEDRQGQNGAVNFEKPRSETEALLARVWSDVLDVREFGVHENFLDLGGQSIAATICIQHIFEIFGVVLPLRSFFEASGTVAGLANIIDELRNANTDTSVANTAEAN